MSTVTRRIHIAAPPDVVRRHVIDPERRRRWLDLDVVPTTDDDGTVTFERDGDDGPSRVDIAVEPDGDGAEVIVTERLVPVDAPADPPAGTQHDARAEVPSGATSYAHASLLLAA